MPDPTACAPTDTKEILMPFVKPLAAAVATVAMTSTAFAGGLSPEIMDPPVAVADQPAPRGTSINPAFVVVGVLAALLIASSLSSDTGDSGENGEG
jgi:hypothetical protein